jgi:hypothetical protein
MALTRVRNGMHIMKREIKEENRMVSRKELFPRDPFELTKAKPTVKKTNKKAPENMPFLG